MVRLRVRCAGAVYRAGKFLPALRIQLFTFQDVYPQLSKATMLVALNRKTAIDLEIAKYVLKVPTCKEFLIPTFILH